MNEMVLVIDKADGPTSFDVVRGVKRLLGPKAKVGHAGSLDPFATGVLVVLTGKATKLSDALLTADKSYRAWAKLGEATDTMDRTGEVEKTAAVPELTEDRIREILAGLQGEWWQTPPMYSAKKVHGVRLYDLARQNIRVRRPPIPVQLHHLELISYQDGVIEFEVSCSKGTYIRSLAEEIGRRLGTVAHLKELRRLTCGQFVLSEAVTLEGLEADLQGWADKGFKNYRKLLQSEWLGPVTRVRGGAVDPTPVRKPASRPASAAFANSIQE
ncbi:tRNA pseudouridine(55) synthase TruB [bacterium]|nr:tRNA pseudouridine(55) synthase TruB [bacterium]